jgi:hypothetical protein
MKRTVLLGTLFAALLAPFGIAQAHGGGVSVAVSTPEFGIRIGAPVYRPAPVYAPVPVYAPAPVYLPPPRVVYPVPVYVPPQRVVVPAPVYYGRPGVWVAPRAYYGHRHWKHRHGDRRDDRYRGRDAYRAGYGF